MSVKRKAPTRRVIDLQSPAKRVDVEEEQSQETQETSQRKFDTTHIYGVGRGKGFRPSLGTRGDHGPLR